MIMNNIGLIFQIGKPHLPGIKVESADDSQQRKIDNHNETEPTETKDKSSTNSVQELHPVEKITVRIKPGGPLPPVSVHDSPPTKK